MRRRTRQLSLKECYDILKIQKGADLEVLKKAYRKRAFELHPDLNPNNSDAGRQFQLLNEAYVALSSVLEPARKGQHKTAADEDAADGAANASQDNDREQGAAGQEQARQNGAGAGDFGQQARDSATSDASEEQKQAERPGNAYEEQDVLRDLLNDPFARRVFEDIYSELGRQQVKTHEDKPLPDNAGRTQAVSAQSGKQDIKNTRIHQSNLAWGTPRWNMDFNKGVKGVVKDWLRRQIDEEQTLRLPSVKLAPGRRIRLQIRQGLSGELHTVDITLPSDFTAGKPVRLRGLGKRIGPWQGDLYLTLYNE